MRRAPIKRLIESAEEHHRPVSQAALRTAESLVRRRIPPLAAPAVALGGYEAQIVADLTGPLGLGLFRYGFHDPVAWAVNHLLRPGDCFIDGGASVGLMTLVAAARVGRHGCVVSCEPHPVTVQSLRRNVALNGFDWVVVCEAALSDESGSADFVRLDGAPAFSSFAPADGERGQHVKVRVVSLADLLDELGRIPALVKLDVEGAEVKALRGARRLLAAHRTSFIVEVEPGHLERQGATVAELKDLLSGLAPHVVLHGRSGFRLAPWSGSWDQLPNGPNLVLLSHG